MHRTIRRRTHEASLVGRNSEARQALATAIMPRRVRVFCTRSSTRQTLRLAWRLRVEFDRASGHSCVCFALAELAAGGREGRSTIVAGMRQQVSLWAGSGLCSTNELVQELNNVSSWTVGLLRWVYGLQVSIVKDSYLGTNHEVQVESAKHRVMNPFSSYIGYHPIQTIRTPHQ